MLDKQKGQTCQVGFISLFFLSLRLRDSTTWLKILLAGSVEGDTRFTHDMHEKRLY